MAPHPDTRRVGRWICATLRIPLVDRATSGPANAAIAERNMLRVRTNRRARKHSGDTREVRQRGTVEILKESVLMKLRSG